jgi:hypothetical protein
MNIIHVSPNTPEWLEERRARIGGSDLKDIVTERGNSVKVGVYKLMADRLALDVPEEFANESDIERGHRLELEGIQAVAAKMGIELIAGNCIWRSDIDGDIQVTPDAHNDDNTVAVEIKNPLPYTHLEYAIDYHSSIASGGLVFNGEVPKEYRYQVLQYFIVNKDLQTHVFASYCKRVPSLPLHMIVTTREMVEADIEHYEHYQRETLDGVRMICERLTF